MSVSTLDQLDRVATLERCAVELRAIATALELALTPPLERWMTAAAMLPATVGAAAQEAAAVVARVRSVAHACDLLAAASRTAAGEYSATEDTRARLLGDLGSIGGAWAGAALAGVARIGMLAGGVAIGGAALAALTTPLAGAAALGLVIETERVDPGDRAARFVGGVLLEHPELVSNPVTASLVQAITAGIDEGQLSFVGVPPVLALLAGQVGVGTSGTRAPTSRILSALRAAGGYRESAVSTRPIVPPGAAATPTAPPTSLAERVSRIPRIETDGGAQVLIERYSRPGRRDAFAVYIAGTAQWGPTGSTTPFDFTSDLSQKAGERSGAYRAVEQAMRQEGIGSDDEVVFVGHSLGGLVAHDLGASGDWRTAGVVEVGSPPSDAPAASDAPDIVIENDSDIVPALGERASDDAIVVRTHPFDADDVPPTAPGDPVPAHSRTIYTRMAAAVDASPDVRVQDARRALDAVSSGATVSSTYYRAERVDSAGGGASQGEPPRFSGRGPGRGSEGAG